MSSKQNVQSGFEPQPSTSGLLNSRRKPKAQISSRKQNIESGFKPQPSTSGLQQNRRKHAADMSRNSSDFDDLSSDDIQVSKLQHSGVKLSGVGASDGDVIRFRGREVSRSKRADSEDRFDSDGSEFSEDSDVIPPTSSAGKHGRGVSKPPGTNKKHGVRYVMSKQRDHQVNEGGSDLSDSEETAQASKRTARLRHTPVVGSRKNAESCKEDRDMGEERNGQNDGVGSVLDFLDEACDSVDRKGRLAQII
jgi:hypothetical protein